MAAGSSAAVPVSELWGLAEYRAGMAAQEMEWRDMRQIPQKAKQIGVASLSSRIYLSVRWIEGGGRARE